MGLSYDIRLAVKIEGADDWLTVATPEYDSPTYNLGRMFRECMKWDFEQGKYYKVSEVIDNIISGIDELIDHEEKYKEYNPPNDWGNTVSALRTLKSLLECISETSDRIPIKYLWVVW